MEQYPILSPISSVIWGLCFTFMMFCGIRYFFLGLKRENFDERIMLFGFASLWMGTGVAFIIYYITLYFVPLTHIGGLLYGNFNDATDLFYIIDRWRYISEVLGCSILFYTYERILRSTKYILTVCNLILLIAYLFIPYNIIEQIWGSHFLLIFLLIILIFYSFTKLSPLDFMPVFTLMTTGYVLVFVGSLFIEGRVRQLVPLELCPVIMIIGIFVSLVITYIKPDSFARNQSIWRRLYFFMLSLSVGCSILFIILTKAEITTSIFILVFDFIIIMLCISTIRLVKSSQSDINGKKRNKHLDVVSMFLRPQTITEEEVSISKEKKICLVCKSNIGGINFLCFECGAFYCEKCFRALSDLENACWACDNALDATKPVRLTMQEEEKALVEEESRKKIG